MRTGFLFTYAVQQIESGVLKGYQHSLVNQKFRFEVECYLFWPPIREGRRVDSEDAKARECYRLAHGSLPCRLERLTDVDLARFGCFSLWQGDGQHPVIHLRDDLVLINAVGERELRR